MLSNASSCLSLSSSRYLVSQDQNRSYLEPKVCKDSKRAGQYQAFSLCRSTQSNPPAQVLIFPQITAQVEENETHMDMCNSHPGLEGPCPR